MAAEYGGATEAYYRTLGPLCSDARLAWREVAEVCAATRRVVPADWGQAAAPDADALRSLKHRLAEVRVRVRVTLPLTLPLTLLLTLTLPLPLTGAVAWQRRHARRCASRTAGGRAARARAAPR